MYINTMKSISVVAALIATYIMTLYATEFTLKILFYFY